VEGSTPAQSGLSCRRPDGGDQQARVAANLAAQLRHPSFGAEHRRGRDLQVLLGHAKLDTTALYTRVATKTISEVMSPLEHIAIKQKKARPPG